MLCEEFDLTQKTAHILLRTIMVKMRDALLKGRPVALFQIGVIRPYLKKGSAYKHPTTGEMEEAEDRVHAKLVLSPNMREDLRAIGRVIRARLK